MNTKTLIIAISSHSAAEYAKGKGLKNSNWTAITPDNYAELLPPLAVPRAQVLWADWSGALPYDMVEAVGFCIRRGNAR